MLQVFTKLADWAVARMGLDATTQLGTSVHFFIEDIVKNKYIDKYKNFDNVLYKEMYRRA